MVRIALALILASHTVMTADRGQPARPTPRPPIQTREPVIERAETKLIVVALQHVDVDHAADILGDALGIRVIPDSRTNKLFIAAADKDMESVHRLLADIDQPPDGGVQSGDAVFAAPVIHRDVHDMAKRVAELFRSDIAVTADDKGRRLLVRGPSSEIAKIANLVKELDTPLPTATIEFALFQVGGMESEFTVEPPADLRSVARQLERFGTPRLLGRLTTSTMEGPGFSLQGQIGNSASVQLNGAILTVPEQSAVKLQVTARLTLSRTRDSTEHEKSRGHANITIETPKFELQTTIIAPRGDYVVVGSAPHGWNPGESVVLVVHVPTEKP